VLTSLSLLGTTSGGKSTIGNLISGRFLLPAGVQETTSKVIEICHDLHARNPKLSFTDAEGRTLGETQIRTHDAEIRQLIANAMSPVDSPLAHIGLRLRLRTRGPGLYQRLVKTCCSAPTVLQGMCVRDGFRIFDFPGFQHSRDERSMRILEEHFDDHGLVIYIFNAEETDNTKEDQLLTAILSLLSRRSRDSRSIIFVLNRVDAFFRDHDPARSLRLALDARQARIRRCVSATLGKTHEGTQEIIPLAAGLVFASEMLGCHRRSIALKDRLLLEYQVENSTYPLLPAHVQDLLPRSARKWTETQWLLVQKAIRKVSGLNMLAEALALQVRRFRLAR
jgi:hypothetical protein